MRQRNPRRKFRAFKDLAPVSLPQQKPLAVLEAAIAVVKHAHPRVDDFASGPCGDYRQPMFHRFTAWSEETIGAFTLRSRVCRDCSLYVGVMA